MDRDSPSLPAAYRLVHLPQVENLRDQVIEAAAGGAEEGTVVLADAVGAEPVGDRDSGPPENGPGNLHAALVLEPESGPDRDHEILFVALVSLCNAIAAHVSPMTALRFGWPNEIRIAAYRIASVWLDRGESAGRRWLTVALTVNVASVPGADEPEQMSLHQAEGNDAIRPPDLFESWAREFITWINLWDDRGFGYVLASWNARADVEDCPVSVRQPGGAIEGMAAGVDGEGRLIVRLKDGAEAKLSSRFFLGWETQ